MDTKATIVRTMPSGSMYGAIGNRGGRLVGMVESLLCLAPSTQLSLHEELALARATVSDMLEVYEQATASSDGALKTKEVVVFGDKLREAIVAVAKIAKAAASIEVSKSIQPALIASLAHNLQAAVNEVVTDDGVRSQMMDRLEASFHNLAQVAAASNNVEAIVSPHEVVAAMDMTIPYKEDKDASV